uniref:Uncharacterized protein n=1 Tax=viral metagenome TaxID=1070528 RepID=A0A6C0E9N7_9ZZZZ
MGDKVEICGKYYCKNITKLDLSCKDLTEIPANIKCLTNLEILILCFNKLTEIKENIFDNLTNLKTLNLSYNRLKEIKENTFDKLTNLKKLYLSSNKLTEIPANIKYLTNLQTLDLSNNKLIEINDDTFDRLTNLQTLDLSSNILTEIKENTFGRLTNLEFLDLEDNQLTEIKENTFNELAYLRTLDLGFNKLTEIKEFTFNRLISLAELYLTNNELTEIKENTFDRLTNLQQLWLDDNKLKSLPLSILNCRRLRGLHYENNRDITIDIRIQRFINRMKNYNNHGIFNDSQNVHSSSIQESVKESINNLMKDPYTCEKEFIIETILPYNLKCIPSLLSYLDDKDYHSTLLLTFYEVFVKVFGRISNSPHKEELMRRLDEEMMESECKCFTGRITRLVNVLNGFYEDIQITISNNERISAIILSTLDGQEMSDELREICRAKLKDIGIEDEEIEVWLR